MIAAVGSKLTRYGQGVVLYRNERNGSTNLVVHYSADPEKRDPSWAAEESRMYGGVTSVDWLQEQEIDFTAEAGILTYWAFDRFKNVVPWIKIPPDWQRWVSVDFGGTVPSCVLFFAQNPLTNQVVVWNEIWVAQVPSNAVKAEVYELLAADAGVAPENLAIGDILADAVGDPKRRQDILDWNAEPWPVPLHGNPPKGKLDLNARKAGENKVNDWLAPSFVCCYRRQVIRDLGTKMRCRKCGVERDGAPLLVILEGKAPNLVRTLPEIRRAAPALAGQEGKEDDEKGQELHAADALRYGVMTWTVEDVGPAPEKDLLAVPSWRLPTDQILQKVRAERVARLERERWEQENELDDSVLTSVDPLTALEQELGLAEEIYG